jgi:nucleoside 2-deoxyribosyltransferase
VANPNIGPRGPILGTDECPHTPEWLRWYNGIDGVYAVCQPLLGGCFSHFWGLEPPEDVKIIDLNAPDDEVLFEGPIPNSVGTIYLSSPYTHKDQSIVDHRVAVTQEVTASLMRHGYHVFSPIVHSHNMAKVLEMPTDFEFWSKWNMAFIKSLDAFAVLRIGGWDQSRGVIAETRRAFGLGKPVYNIFLEPHFRMIEVSHSRIDTGIKVFDDSGLISLLDSGP